MGSSGALSPTSFITSFSKKILPALSSAVCKVSSVQGGPPPVTPPPTGVGDGAIQVTEEALSHSFLSLESPVPHQVTFHSSAHILEVTKLTNDRLGPVSGTRTRFSPLVVVSSPAAQASPGSSLEMQPVRPSHSHRASVSTSRSSGTHTHLQV